MFDNSAHHYIPVDDDVTIHAVTMGQGSPLLLLHGHPETYLMWHKVADMLAQRHTLVACDLRGYGDSSKPHGRADHSTYSKRTMARDCVEVMRRLGFERFDVMGHDRGARVAYRMALDAPEAVDRLVLLDIVSTYDMYAATSAEFAIALFHWYLLVQPKPFPEDLILASRKRYFRNGLHIGRYNSDNDTDAEAFPAAVYEEYLSHYDRECIHAICEEYRAGYWIDRALDEADLSNNSRITAPTLVIWGSNGLVERFFDPPALWARFCEDLTCKTVDCGHFIPEEAPLDLLAALEGFV